MSGLVALGLQEVSVRLGGKTVVDRVSLEVHAGEFAVLVGPNGAGKTSLLRAMAGLVPAEGSLSIEARPAALFSPGERARKIAYLAQSGEIHWPVAARDVVALGRLPFGATAQKLDVADRAAIASALAACDLGAVAGRRVTELSGGEKARVLLARALAVEAPILLLDEPVAGFDPAHQIAAMRRLAQLAAAGRTIVAVLHDLTLALRFATQLILVNRGRLADAGPPAEIVARKTLDAVFEMAFASVEIDGTRVILPSIGD